MSGTHRHFHEELADVRERLLAMAGAAEAALDQALDALLRHDPLQAKAVIAGDDDIDRREIAVEERCIELVALHQPMARDLRLLLSLLRIANALERVGDHAVNIAEAAVRLAPTAPARDGPEIAEMARLARAMLSDAVDAFTHADAEAARAVCRRDDQIDARNRALITAVIAQMSREPGTVAVGMDVVLVSRNLERVADLATNIAEGVVYLVEGRTIKHIGETGRDDRREG